MDYWQLLLLFGVGCMAGIINVMAGGGSAFTLPTLIFLGLDAILANGTNRLAILIQNIFAIASFRQQKMHQFKKSFKIALWTIPGSICGALMAIRIQEKWFQYILGIVLIGIVFSMLFSPANRSAKSKTDVANVSSKSWLIYPIMLGIGFYGGFIQAGIGFLLMASLFHFLKENLVMVNTHKVFIVFIYTIPALAIFGWSGNISWELGLSLATGNALGAWWSARWSVKKGDKIIRYALIVAILVIAMKLLNLL